MSRTYKKLIFKLAGRDYRRFAKRQASKKVRRYPHPIQDGNSYKKIYNSWDIYDDVSDGRFDDFDHYKKPSFFTRNKQNFYYT